MSTHAKLICGYTDHTGNWIINEQYYRNSDGYIEAVKPLLVKYVKDVLLETSADISEFIKAWNEDMEYRSWEWEEIKEYGFGDCEYQYYIDTSSRNEIRVSIVELDWEFYSRYAVDSYKVLEEFSITKDGGVNVE